MSHTDSSPQLPRGLEGSTSRSDAPPTVNDAIEVQNIINKMIYRLENDPGLIANGSTGSGSDDDGSVRGVKSGDELPTAENKISKDAMFLTKSLEVKILHFFCVLNSAESQEREVSRLRGVLLPSNQYVVSKMEQDDDITWVQFVLDRKNAAVDIKDNNIVALYEAFHSIKDSKYAEDIKKNILFIRSKVETESGTVEKKSVESEFYTDLVGWFDLTLDKNAERYLVSNPNPRSYRPARGVMDSIEFVDARIKYYKENATTNRRCMATYLMLCKFGALQKWLCLVEGIIYIESEPDEMIDLEQDYMSFIFGFKFESLC